MNTNTELVTTETQSGALALSATDLLQNVIRAARDPGVDVDKMERMVQLYERITARQAEMDFNEALRGVQSKIPPVVKTSRNPSTNSGYVKMEHIQDIVNPILFDHGFSLSYGTDQSSLQNHYGVTALLAHSNGHSRLYRCDVPADTHGPKGQQNKTATHGFGSAVSYGQRYLVKLIFNIRLIGEDDDGNRGQRLKPAGPSSVAAPDPELRIYAEQLWSLMKDIRGPEKNWNKINEWLWREEVIDAAADERAPNFTAAKFKQVIEKVKAKLA